MQDITLTLTVQEVNFLLQVMGELPTKSGAWNLLAKIEQQGKSQVSEPAQAEAA